MRRLLLAVLLALATAASASELYIIPAFARSVSNGTTSWRSEVFLTNPHDHAVDIELDLVIGKTEEYGCRFPEFSIPFPQRILPGQTSAVCMPFTARGAFAFRASDPLVVTSEMTAWRRLGDAFAGTRQTIEPGRRWIEPGERALIANVPIGSGYRANLVAVNPGESSITIRYTIVRTGSYAPVNHLYETIDGTIDVAPRSMTMTLLPEGPQYDCHGRVPCGNAIQHAVTVESTGRFYAATSSIENDLDATFRSPYLP